MSIRALRTLQAIARHGSFARAGEAVGLTQSAVSLQVKALEREFDVRLFDRSRRRPVLTDEGRIVLVQAERALAAYDSIAASLGDERALAGRLKLGCLPSGLAGIVPDALAALKRDHPRVRVHVTGGMSLDLAEKVATGELDAAVSVEPVRPFRQDLARTPLYQDRFWIVAPPGSEGRSAEDLLSTLPFIRLDSSDLTGRLIDQELRRRRLAVRDEMVFDNLEVIHRMVALGLGVAIIALSEEGRAREPLVHLPFGQPQLTRNVVLLERHDRRDHPIAAALARAIGARSLEVSPGPSGD